MARDRGACLPLRQNEVGKKGKVEVSQSGGWRGRRVPSTTNALLIRAAALPTSLGLSALKLW